MKNNNIDKTLLKINAVKIDPINKFQWASGVLSPVYIDNRIIGSFPVARNKIYSALADLVSKQFPDASGILGTATGGIIPAAFAAQKLNLPVGYVRSQNKKHGTCRVVEGSFQPGQKVVIVEDLISTGGSALEAVAAARSESLEVLGVVAIFSYNLKQAELNFRHVGVNYHTLTGISELLKVAHQNKILSQHQVDDVRQALDVIFN